jgi:hypothetical protein
MFLLIVGVIIVCSGVYDLFVPAQEHTVLASLHPSLWWGGVITVGGLIFLLANRKKTI